MNQSSTVFFIISVLAAVFLAPLSHAAFNDKKAIAKSAGKYKGTWKNTSTFGSNDFKTVDGKGNVKIPGMIRLPRKPKKINFKLPKDVLDPPPVTKVKIKKTVVRRRGKLIIHKGKGIQNLLFFSPDDKMKGRGSAKLKARGRKFVASGKYSARNTDSTPAGPDKVAGKFKGKG